jgi:hypothetical protein
LAKGLQWQLSAICKTAIFENESCWQF